MRTANRPRSYCPLRIQVKAKLWNWSRRAHHEGPAHLCEDGRGVGTRPRSTRLHRAAHHSARRSSRCSVALPPASGGVPHATIRTRPGRRPLTPVWALMSSSLARGDRVQKAPVDPCEAEIDLLSQLIKPGSFKVFRMSNQRSIGEDDDVGVSAGLEGRHDLPRSGHDRLDRVAGPLLEGRSLLRDSASAEAKQAYVAAGFEVEK